MSQPDPLDAGTGGYGYGQEELAKWPARVAAALIDLAIFWVPLTLTAQLVDLGGAAGAVGTLLSAAVIALGGYNVWFRQGRTGQTFGKRVLGIRLVRLDDGEPVGVPLALGRYLLHWADMLPLLTGWLWPLWDGNRQTFADKIVGTVVVADAGRGQDMPWYASARA